MPPNTIKLIFNGAMATQDALDAQNTQVITGFPKFMKFPLELRDLVWESVESSPQVIYVHLARDVTSEKREVSEDRRVENITRTTRWVEGGFKALSEVPAVLRCSGESRKAALQKYKKLGDNPLVSFNPETDVLYFENTIAFKLFTGIKKPVLPVGTLDKAARVELYKAETEAANRRLDLEFAVRGINLEAIEGLHDTLKHMVIGLKHVGGSQKAINFADCLKWKGLQSLTIWDRQNQSTHQVQGKTAILAEWAKLYKDAQQVPKLLFSVAYKREELERGDTTRLMREIARLDAAQRANVEGAN